MPIYQAHELAAWTAGRWCGDMPDSLNGISHDTRTAEPGSLYVALRGEQFDGHAFLPEAARKGCVAALVEEDLDPAAVQLPLLRVQDTRAALSAMAAGWRKHAIRGRVLGITGSVGKTTVKAMTASVATQAGTPVYMSPGNWNNDIGLPLSLLATEPVCTFAVYEAGMNHPGEIQPLSHIMAPDWGLVTRIGKAHMAAFDSLEAVAHEKGSLLSEIHSEGKAFLCHDEPWLDVLKGYADCQVVTFSMQGHPEASYTFDWNAAAGSLEVTAANGPASMINVAHSAPFMQFNAAFAAMVGFELGLSEQQIAAGLANVQLPGMRWERRRLYDRCWILDSYNANPTSMRAAIEAVSTPPDSQPCWLVLGSMRELGDAEQAEHKALGAFIAERDVAGVITVGNTAEYIGTGLETASFKGHYLHAASTDVAAGLLMDHIPAGSTVLLKASRSDRLEAIIDALSAESGVR